MNFHHFMRPARQLMPLALILISAIAAAAAYFQALDYPFIFDDTSYLTENAKLSGLHLTGLWRLFAEPYNDFAEFLPLRDLSYWFDIKLFGLTPAVFRVHNILLYLLCLPLVYGATSCVWRYFRPGDAASVPWAAAAVTALFALHPAHVEAVVWISSRKYVLPNLFSMLALWFALSARREHGFSVPHAAMALIAFVAVMLSKSSYVAVAPVIALLWIMFWRDIPASDRRRSLLLWPLAIMLLAGLLLMFFIVSSEKREHVYFGFEAAVRSLAVLGWLTRISVSLEGHHYFYPVFEDSYLYFRVGLGIAALVAAATGGLMLLRKRTLEGFILAAFLLLCLPYLQLIPYAAPSLVSDRFVALAVWPAILLIVALSWRLKPVPRAVLLLVFALLWGFQTFERSRDWRSFEALVDADLRAFPGYSMPAVYKVIDQYTHGLTREAMKTASRITDPELRDVAVGLIKADGAVSYAEVTGKRQEAMALLWKLWLDHKKLPVQATWNSPIKNLWLTRENMFKGEWMRLSASFPEDVPIRYNAELWMWDALDNGSPSARLNAAAESHPLVEPARSAAFKKLGLDLANSGFMAEAEAPLRAALNQLQPDLWPHCLLSELYQQGNRIEEAARAEAACRTHVRIRGF